MSYLFNALLAIVWIVFLLLVLKSKYGVIRGLFPDQQT